MTATAGDPHDRPRASPVVRATRAFTLIAVVCAVFADFEVQALHPWLELGRLGLGFVTPDFLATEDLFGAVLRTMAMAFLAVVVAAPLGFLLCLVYPRSQAVRVACAFLRSIHELFWALILIQLFGLSATSGVLAIVIPFTCIFAKVFSEILEEGDRRPAEAIPGRPGFVSRFLYGELPDLSGQIVTYTLYRVECALRSSAVMGFVGLPTLGFHLESAFRQGHYSEAGAILLLVYAAIATVRLWFRPILFPFFLAVALWVLPFGADVSVANIVRFLTVDIVPAPLRNGHGFAAFADWLWMLAANQAGPGLLNTIILTQMSLVAAGAVTLLAFPLASRRFAGPRGRVAGHVFLVVVRSTPEYIIAYMVLLICGPSMLPAFVALSLHNGAIIGHLIARLTDTLPLRDDAPKGADLWAFEAVPRVYGQFLAFLFYRWEIIFRETAILGILGVHTLGFFVDSAISELRFDRAIVLIAVTGLAGMTINWISTTVRRRLRLPVNIDDARAR